MADLIDRAALLEQKREMELCFAVTEWDIENAPAVDAVEVGSCDGCFYSNRKRPQKCSCCRRNKDLKDCYEEGEK